ncbi:MULTISPECIES: bifunctional 2-polyprenyl-6-hydroxyphenol methylase/3-demethylubiquinol 3-O-methyltransferase UbiG [Okeania]|uniref:3-demethylubiquinone-9 3-O-methyltransferase n=1 Tax=Okeania hirsuta TaxID=1458930 RepID=A0A3N6MR32_9CYAN|nr:MULTISPECIES: bifunctional 2-polyprenyl-6-hydroxyphenol methylase/3-demethylubiquinol 3-O-methyltransferase UbiG [Okeania]NET13807.1 3-demethylubiquinone-9 3-O-methyltransferase [Okeania sp. SIO1H6]NES76289.1 3-demethylubiquinone-9 3-O-methyltransferase [Okeania sp. SIO1H4]NES89052.1 3-demethylubiquinone-9 3-O-methyltransferase [Okeania sp. SIO2B9]NET19733.1 3-demethylubiquinone-9 3-O-methyltransferase [Okeania sp. SIO1H5]NET74589.1 3-demethylubiquinone-9 3-O-methyltransferase [Okeania sp. 
MKKNDLEFYDLSANQWWDKNAKIYALYYLNQPRFKFFDRYVPHWQGLKVLDVGCGGGFSCEFMAKRGAIIYGIDSSAKCIEVAQKHSGENSLDINYKIGIAESLPYENNTFDVVICVDVLEHVSDYRQVVSEIYRVLKPGGIFLYDTINRNFQSRFMMIWLMENLLRLIPQGVHNWDKFILPEELKELMLSLDFVEVEMKGFDLFGEIGFVLGELNTLRKNLKFDKSLQIFIRKLIQVWKTNFINYQLYRKTGSFQININDDMSIMYIGKALKNKETP